MLLVLDLFSYVACSETVMANISMRDNIPEYIQQYIYANVSARTVLPPPVNAGNSVVEGLGFDSMWRSGCVCPSGGQVLSDSARVLLGCYTESHYLVFLLLLH